MFMPFVVFALFSVNRDHFLVSVTSKDELYYF